MKKIEPSISVVVTAHNAAETIQDCLRSVAGNLGAEPDDVEIILVDDRSADGTADAARALALECLRILRIDSYQDRSLTARQIALDLGFRSARGEVILVTDADAIVPQDWISRMVGISWIWWSCPISPNCPARGSRVFSVL